MSKWYNPERNKAEEREAEDYTPVMAQCAWCDCVGQLGDEIYASGDEFFCSEGCEKLYRRQT